MPLIDLCKTRWAERHNAYSHFYTSFKYIIIALELIALGLYRDTYDEVFRTAVWDSKSKTDASGLLTGLTSFGFIVAFLTAYQLLSHLEGITVKLQSSSLDFIEAHDMIKEVKGVYAELRSTIDLHFHKFYEHAVRMAASVNVIPTMPRVTGKQCHRVNAPSDSVESHYLWNTVIPFLDYVISDLNLQFSEASITCSCLVGLVPSVITPKTIFLLL